MIDVNRVMEIHRRNMTERPYATSFREGTVTNPHQWSENTMLDTIMDYNKEQEGK